MGVYMQHASMQAGATIAKLFNLYRVCVCVCVCACACACACACPFKRIHIAVCGLIGTKFGTHMQIHL